MDLDPDKVVNMVGNSVRIIDCFGILDDEKSAGLNSAARSKVSAGATSAV